MTTWQRGPRDRHRAAGTSSRARSPDFVDKVHAAERRHACPAPRSSRTRRKDTTPLALRANVEHNHVLHERVVIVSGRTENVPHVPLGPSGSTVDDLGDATDGILHLDGPVRLPGHHRLPRGRSGRRPRRNGELDSRPGPRRRVVLRLPDHATPHTAARDERVAQGLFIGLAHNAASQAEFLHLPDERTVVMGSQINL